MRLALLGYGRMGREVEEAAQQKGHEIVAVIDDPAGATRGKLSDAQVAIDFSTPGAAVPNIRKVAAQKLDLVVGTTGWYDAMDEARTAVSGAGTGLVWAPNFSLGVQLFLRLAREAGRLVNALDEYDVFVHEVHHRHKLDHPSGTAVKLADILVAELDRKQRWAEGPPEGAPDPAVLWVSSSRAGEVPGTHLVGLEGPHDGVEVKHSARGRGGFAQGAVAAAEWIHGRKGFFSIDDMLSERFGTHD
jgi:4-hydroxy-tetrahydrodipicolinate reductase